MQKYIQIAKKGKKRNSSHTGSVSVTDKTKLTQTKNFLVCRVCRNHLNRPFKKIGDFPQTLTKGQLLPTCESLRARIFPWEPRSLSSIPRAHAAQAKAIARWSRAFRAFPKHKGPGPTDLGFTGILILAYYNPYNFTGYLLQIDMLSSEKRWQVGKDLFTYFPIVYYPGCMEKTKLLGFDNLYKLRLIDMAQKVD